MLEKTLRLIYFVGYRFDPDLIDKYGNQQIDNEYHVNRNILRPTRKTRDQIEILSNLKYREPGRRYIGKFTTWLTFKLQVDKLVWHTIDSSWNLLPTNESYGELTKQFWLRKTFDNIFDF